MTKCIICFAEHNRMWTETKPAMYCESCAAIKEDSVDKVSPIIDNLYLSGMIAAGKFEGARLCVHENTPTYTGQYFHVPILTKRPNDSIDRTGAIASVEALNNACSIIDEHLKKGEKILVHCVGGVERSPLTLAWYFVHWTKDFDGLIEAYNFLKAKRPIVSERMFWLPQT